MRGGELKGRDGTGRGGGEGRGGDGDEGREGRGRGGAEGRAPQYSSQVGAYVRGGGTLEDGSMKFCTFVESLDVIKCANFHVYLMINLRARWGSKMSFSL
jgi:hypothetical protein